MKRACAIGMLVSLLTTAVTAQDKPVRAAAGTFSVAGVVMSASGQEPLGGITVTLAPAINSRPRTNLRNVPFRASDDLLTTRTAGDGTFSFDQVKAGKYSLTAAGRGFARQSFNEHEQFSSAVVVGPDKVSTGIEFRLEPDASISGTIVDEHNDPVMNAQVMLFRAGIQEGRRGIFRAQQTMSNDLGRYHFAHVRPGKYYVVISATPWYAENGRTDMRGVAGGMVRGPRFYAEPAGASNPALDVAYPLTFYPGVTNSQDAEPINITPGVREDADFTLTAVPSIHVRVRVPSDNPQQNVVAMLTKEVFGTADFGGNIRSINYGQGYTEMSGITPGRYVLQLRGVGPERGPRLMSEREIEITGDTEINGSDMPAGVSVSGTVHFAGSAPPGDVRLVLRRMGMPTPPLRVDEKGEISSEEPIAPGQYELFLPMPNYQIIRISATGAKLEGQSITVGSEEVHLKIEAAKALARIEGVVKKDGKGFAGAMVVLVPQDMSRPTMYRRDQSDSDGSFVLSSVAPGAYTLVAIENGWDLEWSVPQTMKAFLAAGETVQVAGDGDYHVDAKVQSLPGAP